MPKVYGRNPLDMMGRGGEKDLSPSARLQLRRDLKQLGFEGASEALQPKDNFAVRVGSGSFKPHVEEVWFVRRQASNLAKMMGREPDPMVEKEGSGTALPRRSVESRKAWAKEHQRSGRVKASEESFTRMIDELMGRLRTTFESLVYNRDFDMLTLKNMDRHTLQMYMAKADADIEEIGTLYGQLVSMLPMVDGATGATQRIGEATNELAMLRAELTGVNRTFRTETMTIRAGGRVHAEGAAGSDEDGAGGLLI